MKTDEQWRKYRGEEYRGAIIESAHYGGYEWYHPDYVDCDPYEGCFGCGVSDSIEDAKESIDEFLEDQKENEN